MFGDRIAHRVKKSAMAGGVKKAPRALRAHAEPSGLVVTGQKATGRVGRDQANRRSVRPWVARAWSVLAGQDPAQWTPLTSLRTTGSVSRCYPDDLYLPKHGLVRVTPPAGGPKAVYPDLRGIEVVVVGRGAMVLVTVFTICLPLRRYLYLHLWLPLPKIRSVTWRSVFATRGSRGDHRPPGA